VRNKYEVRGNVTAIIINSKTHGLHETLISTKSLERANEFSSWHVSFDNKNQTFYVQGTIVVGKGKRKTISLHRWLTYALDGMEVDHIDLNTLNNTDENLRVITSAENRQNRNLDKHNVSGYRNVSWYKNRDMWKVSIRFEGKQKHIGYFRDINEANQAAIEARRKYMPYSQEASLREVAQ
jgi:hypothetical protein